MRTRSGTVRLIAGLLAAVLPAFSLSGASAENVLTWPSGVPIVGEQMFYGNTSIETVVLQEGVTGIASQAFADTSLKEIFLPSTLDTSQIAEDAFGTIRPVIDVCPIVHAPEGSDAYHWARDLGLQVEFRALLIGEKSFLRNGEIEQAVRNIGDVNRMNKMLQSVYGYTGDSYSISCGTDYSYERIRSAIEETFAGAREQDISLFFIATHGISSDGGLEMPYLGPVLSDYKERKDYIEAYNQYMESYTRKLTFDVLAEWLSNIPGRIIVVLESCYSGYAIYDPEIAENSLKNIRILNTAKTEATDSGTAEDADLFAELAVQVFAGKDPGVRVPQRPDGSSGGMRKKAGEMRQPKFYVLAASRHNEESWGEANGVQNPMNLFTKWLIQGIGTAAKSPADNSPKNGALTLNELFQYVKTQSDKPIMYDSTGTAIYQHVQCYPEDCNFVCFLLK